MGMLRSGNESELVKTLDYHAEGGTIQVNGQPCTLTKYRVQANYQVPGWRTQIECAFKNKQIYKNVETLSGDYAWDEDMPGAELVAGQGKAVPNPASLVERRIRLWASPHGAVKAAIAGAAGISPLESFGENPAVLLDAQAKAGVKSLTTLEWQGEKAIVTFPVPFVPGATAVATLTSRTASTGFGANTASEEIGIAQAHIAIAALRAFPCGHPCRIRKPEIQPPATLPKSAIR